VTLRHRVLPFGGYRGYASVAAADVASKKESALPTVFMFVIVFSLLLGVSFLLRLCLYGAIHKII
jgi:hypothetical protein